MGLFGVVTPGQNCKWPLFYGIDYHSHWGTEYGGMAVMGHELVRRIHRISQSQFKTEFAPDMDIFAGSMGIGVISAKEEQPLMINPVNKQIGLFTIAMLGYIDNAEELTTELTASGILKFNGREKPINQVELIGLMISQSDNLISGIDKMFYRIEGSVSLLILNAEGIIAARSRYGHTPLFLAQKEDSWAVTLETTALPNLGYKVVKSLLPGEIISINENGPTTRYQDCSSRMQLCAFLPIYTGFPSAEFGDITAEGYREKAGAFHARQDLDQGLIAQMVAGMADSGTAYGIGYAKETIDYAKILAASGENDVKKLLDMIVPFRRPLAKYTPSWARSYNWPKQVDRDRVAKMKQIPIRDVWDSLESLILTEDSIVRGTQLAQYFKQLRHIVESLWEKSWPEMHVRIGCPPLAWPCKYMLSTRTREELAARKAVTKLIGHAPTDEEMLVYIDPATDEYAQMVDVIAQELGVASLRYLPKEEMIRIIGLPADQVCTHCWDGTGV